MEDISERKALEQKLQKLDESQKTIMPMVAQDLKGSTNNIKSLNGYLKKNLEKQKQNLSFTDLINHTCDSVYVIIKDLLLIQG